MEYYNCHCHYFDDGYVLCKNCCRWLDKVEVYETIVYTKNKDAKPVTHAKRWKNKNQTSNKK